MLYEGFTEPDMLQLAACLETCCNHPLAAVIVGHAAAKQLPLDAHVSNSQVLPGENRPCFSVGKEQHADDYDVGHRSLLLIRASSCWQVFCLHYMQDWDSLVRWQAVRQQLATAG